VRGGLGLNPALFKLGWDIELRPNLRLSHAALAIIYYNSGRFFPFSIIN